MILDKIRDCRYPNIQVNTFEDMSEVLNITNPKKNCKVNEDCDISVGNSDCVSVDKISANNGGTNLFEN